jgi:hypothetical protein
MRVGIPVVLHFQETQTPQVARDEFTKFVATCLLRFIVPDRHPDASKEIVKGASNGHLRLRWQESKDNTV